MNPWDRQPFDTDETFLWFCAYRDAKPPRSLSRIMVPGKRTATLQQKLDWFNAGHWRDRAIAWDEHLDSLRQQEREDATKDGSRAQVEMEKELVARGADLVLRELDKIERTSMDSDAELDASTVAKTMTSVEKVIKASRLVRGETTENPGSGELDLSKLSLEELKALRDLRNKARKVPEA